MMKFEMSGSTVSAVLLLLAAGISAFAQNGKLKLSITPKQAYVFVDDKAISEASKHHILSLSAGEHKVELVNYGYQPVTRTVAIAPGKTTELSVSLEGIASKVPGPFGAITIKGADRDAVLLNGKTPEFFVGHGDEFDNDWWWKQELVVPPGTYQVTIRGGDKDVWSGDINVPANQRVVVDGSKGIRKTVPWPRGQKLNSIPRFTVGIASATVAVAKPVAELSVATAQLKCGDTSQLKWTSSDAPQVEIKPLGPVRASGEQTIQPKQTTEYDLMATGPGGTATSSNTVNVDTAIQTDFELSPTEVHYKRVGDNVVEDGSTALNWAATNASTVSINSLGTVAASGSRNLTVVPQKNDFGQVDENVSYTLTATNECGGAATQTVALHIVGSIEPGPLAMNSVYFETDRPGKGNSEAALLPSERQTLAIIADEFKRYLTYKSDAQLVLSGYADKRGPAVYNQRLSERRAALAKRFLVEHGVPEENIETQAFGKGKNLTAEDVKVLLDGNKDLSVEARQRVIRKLSNIVLAYNRRVDFTLSSTGQESARAYPFNTDDFSRLVERNGPQKKRGVTLAAETEKVGN